MSIGMWVAVSVVVLIVLKVTFYYFIRRALKKSEE
jgi:uncharacterized membrane protein